MQIVDASILKTYIFQKGFITEGAKLKREQEAQNSTLQVGCLLHSQPISCRNAVQRRVWELDLC